MDTQLKGKKALVTGSSSGIGEAVAKYLAKEGVSVVVHGRRASEAERVVKEIKAAGGQAAVALGDLAKDSDAQQVVKTALAAFGGIDILVNNAGAYAMKPWMDSSAAKWAEMFNEDVISMVRMVQGLVPGMKTGGWGRVINIASGVASYPFALGPDYSASKAAVVNLTVSLAKDLANTGITVNTISPGPVVTEGFKKFFLEMVKPMGWTGEWPEIEKRGAKEIMPNPTGRLAHVEDIAAAVAYLASPLAGFVNANNLRVDGGMGGAIN